MRLLIALLTLASLAQAETVKSFEARPQTERVQIVSGFIEKMTADIGKTNAAMAQAIRMWFVAKPAGMPVSEGVEKLSAELAALDAVAIDGKADLTKIQIEGVIVKVVKDRFPPQQAAQK